MLLTYCDLPLRQVEKYGTEASNQPLLNCEGLQDLCIDTASVNVRLMRRALEVDSTRFVLSGKLADVCAALEHLAAQENRNALRSAMQ